MNRLLQDKLLTLSVFFALTISLVTGCASLSTAPAARKAAQQEEIEKQVAARNYHKALLLLKKAEPDEKKEAFKSQRRRIETLAMAFENETEQEATRRVERNDLRGAIEIISLALKKTPDSARLKNMQQTLTKERDIRLKESERNLLLIEAEYLFYQLELYDEQKLLEKLSLLSRWRQSHMKSSLRSLHEDLISCGKEALATSQEAMAERCLQMAKAIDYTNAVKVLLAKIDSDPQNPSIVPLSETRKTRPSSSSSTSFQSMEVELNQEIDKGELVTACEILTKLEQFPDSIEQLRDYRQKLDREMKTQISKLQKEGSRLYRNGNITEARSTWQKVLELDPENHTALEKIARAEKVLKKIQLLQESQQKAPADQ